MATIPLTLPDGTVLQYHGDPSLIPDIYDTKTGLPVPLAPARPNTFPNGVPLANSSPSTAQTSAQQPASSSTRPWWSYLPGFDEVYSALTGDTTTANRNYIIDGTIIVVGLFLIAGAIFGLESVRNTTISVAKKGAEIAAA